VRYHGRGEPAETARAVQEGSINLNLVFLAVGVITIGLAVDGILTGYIRFQFWQDERATGPIMFWSSIALYLVMGGLLIFLGVTGLISN
jgi:hypothetical protein